MTKIPPPSRSERKATRSPSGEKDGAVSGGRAVRGEVDRVAAPDPLQVDVRVPGRVAHEHERGAGGADLGLALLTGQVGELLERSRHGAGTPAAPSDPPPDLDAAAEQGQRGETERDGAAATGAAAAAAR